MKTEDLHKAQREQEMNRLIDLADLHFVEHGQFPSKIRVGVNIGKRLFPEGANRAVTPDFTVELDATLAPDEVVVDAKVLPQPVLKK